MEINKLNTNVVNANVAKTKDVENTIARKVQEKRDVETNPSTATTNSAKVELKYNDLQEQKLDNIEKKQNDKMLETQRQNRLAEIKEKIKNGQFTVDSNALADKMMNNKSTMSVLLNQ